MQVAVMAVQWSEGGWSRCTQRGRTVAGGSRGCRTQWPIQQGRTAMEFAMMTGMKLAVALGGELRLAAVGKENDYCGGDETGFEIVPQRRRVVAVKDEEQ
ncbi:3-isopropylmalate dehydratase large subunit [Sesbania bispinosa]|nr:3-isopropylmalate dehydratase large subunit [Sesbania bispinosa]